MNRVPNAEAVSDELAPGSPPALKRGCRCSVLLNRPTAPPEQHLVAPDCPLHTLPPTDPAALPDRDHQRGHRRRVDEQ